jgi:hypothetical protein
MKFLGWFVFVVGLTIGVQSALAAPDTTEERPVVITAAPEKATPARPAARPVAGPMAASKPAEMKPAPAVAMKAAPAETKKPKQSKDSKAAYWLGIIIPVLVGIIGVLGAAGLMKWTKNDKAQMILGMIRQGVASFLKYSEGTKAEWDDAVAKLLNDVNEALIAMGKKPLTDEEKEAYKKVAEKEKDIQGPDKTDTKEEPKEEG